VTLYSQIEAQVVLQGGKMWTVDELFEQFPKTFGQALGKAP
jgi:hypothetical protein